MDKDIYNLGIAQYAHMTGLDDMDRDKDGFIILKPTAKRIDDKMSGLTTDISNLEAKLKKFKAEKAKTEKMKDTKEYKESKKLLSKKKAKKKKMTLLESVFNNADKMAEEDDSEDDEDEDGEYKDSRKTKAAVRKKTDTLDTTYGKRFSPVVSMLYDTITEFDQIAANIEKELDDSHSQGKSMYRSGMIGNMISAKNSKLSAINKLADVAKTVSDLEYKKDKDKKSEEGADSSKMIASLGSKYLRGGGMFEEDSKKKGKKKGKVKVNDKPLKKYRNDDDDEDDEEEDSSIRKQRESDQRELAAEFAKTLSNRKKEITLTPHERFIAMEGKYAFVVVADPIDPDNTWKFVAVDPKSGKELKDFKDKYKDLYPKKKNCRMIFDLGKLKCTDKNSSRSYKLILKD